ncbi:MAG: DUF2249 domain-containing protein [Melioribacter sp.]|uniref:DUF2249 domain-containing protein n=1 Tax=Rosettibacter primus TaxID=3111523 RepID=UPI00247E9758|nr:DUF2249 domain-containing protein [Melioribacter sp.]
MKISEVLSKYPETIDVFMKVSPHFRKLQNKLLRKSLASRVTVRQAASIAGVELNKLLFELNKAINKEVCFNNETLKEEMGPTIMGKPEHLYSVPQEKIIQLDVRPIINSGKDPFLDIMSKVKNLKDDEVLLIINSFEPIPLYTVLGNKGFNHWTEKIDDAFKVYFFKSGTTQKNLETEQKTEINLSNYEKIIELDVRELPPPEPMMKILEKLADVDDKTVLLVHHHREPMMLYPKLEERGFKAIANKMEENYYKVVIFQKEE